MKVSGIRDLAFSEPKAFLAWSMHQPFPAVPIPPPHPPRLLQGIFPPCQPRRGIGTAGIDWCITVMVKEIYLKILSCHWHHLCELSRKNRQHPCQYIYIGEFSSSKGIHDSIGVWVPLHGFWIPATRFFVSGTWIWIPILLLVAFWINLHSGFQSPGLWISQQLSRFRDSPSKNFVDSKSVDSLTHSLLCNTLPLTERKDC